MSKLKFGTSSNKLKGEDQLTMKVFLDHPLFDPSWVYVNILEGLLKYNRIGFKIHINYWDEDGKLKVRDKKISVEDLLEHSPEVQEFARMYYPQHAL